VELQALVEEYASEGIGQVLYGTLLTVAGKVVIAGRYPTTYSPTGHWDEDAVTILVHDWATTKLLQRGHLEHLLLLNRTIRGFRLGLELSFRDFLISQRKRTTLDHLFRRTNQILNRDDRFKLIVSATKKAHQIWGRTDWDDREPFQGSDGDLIAAGFRIDEVPVIRYRAEAKKLSPILTDPDLAVFLLRLLDELGRPLSIGQIVTVFKHRFDLLEAHLAGLDDPVAPNQNGRPLTLSETISADLTTEDVIVSEELASELLSEMPLRQQRALLEYAQPGATLMSVAIRLGCSKSTVDNEIRRALDLIARRTDSHGEARDVYDLILERLSADQSLFTV
jgi:hypothetical protein